MTERTDLEIIQLIDHARTNLTETTNVEFKDARGGIPSDLWRPISSFSHKPKGGIIVFGITENRTAGTMDVTGNLDLALLQEQIASYLADRMINNGPSNIRMITYEGVEVIVLTVDETPNENKPCYERSLGLPRGACLRIGNTNKVISDEEMKSFIKNSSLFKYDKSNAPETALSMISTDKVRDFLEKSAKKVGRKGLDNTPTVEVMKNLGVIDEFEGQELPTIAGFLIFSKDRPQKLRKYSRYVIHCVRYQAESVASPIIDKLDIEGTLDEHIDLMLKFILRNISLKAKIVGTKRIEQYEYPEEALRELVANAVIHRDYMITETYTNISIFSNRIEISNPGNLPPGVTIENIKDAQFSRNEIIAQILKDMDYLEEYGRGIDIVFSRMNEWSLLPPIFKNMSNSFKVTLLGEVFTGLNERQIDIWKLIQEKQSITSKMCQEQFPEVSRQTLVTDLNKLVEIGLLVQKGASSLTHYQANY
jgi:ATP-dependent DNA helicase RecG